MPNQPPKRRAGRKRRTERPKRYRVTLDLYPSKDAVLIAFFEAIPEGKRAEYTKARLLSGTVLLAEETAPADSAALGSIFDMME